MTPELLRFEVDGDVATAVVRLVSGERRYRFEVTEGAINDAPGFHNDLWDWPQLAYQIRRGAGRAVRQEKASKAAA